MVAYQVVLALEVAISNNSPFNALILQARPFKVPASLNVPSESPKLPTEFWSDSIRLFIILAVEARRLSMAWFISLFSWVIEK